MPLKPINQELYVDKTMQRGKSDSMRASSYSKLHQLKAIHSQLRAEHNFSQAIENVYKSNEKFLGEERILKLSKSVEK